MQINGHHVLNANNYDMEQGEPSVFVTESARALLPSAQHNKSASRIFSGLSLLHNCPNF